MLLQHHSTSPASVRKLLHYAIDPTGCTPQLFAGFAKAKLPGEQRWIVSATTAIHQKSLLLIADELATDKSAASRFRSRLGSDLANELNEKDRIEFEAKVVLEFQTLAEQHGKESIGGMTIRELSDGSIFAVRHLRLGKTAKELSGETLDGKMVKIEDFRDRVLLIDFWATWCAPCVMALPDLQKSVAEIGESNFSVIGVCADKDKRKLSQFIKRHDVRWPNIFDPNSTLEKRWQPLSLPMYYVLDEAGKVRYRGDDHVAAVAVVKSLLAVDTAAARSIIETLDANKDGRIEKTEFPKEGQAIFEKADANKDAALSLDEIIEFLRDGKVKSEAVEVSPTQQKGDRTKR